MASHTASQRYLSTRGGSYDLSFEDVVLKGLAADGGLFIPEEIPSLPADWASKWKDYTFEELAYEIFSLYVSSTEIPAADLKDLIKRSYATFRAADRTPTVTLDEKRNIHLLELFHGPTFAFKDVALQFLGNLFEYFLIRRNRGKAEGEKEHLTVIGATSGDTGSAAIYGLRGKKDASVFIMHPKGKVSPIQEAQMTTVLDANVHNLAVDGTFDDCQDFVKALFADEEINKTHRLAAVNSINWARILAQITYYFHAYFSLVRSPAFTSGDHVRFVVPTGNFGDILAGYFAKRMGLPAEKLVIATNENDILNRFWRSGYYEKKEVHGRAAAGGLKQDGAQAHADGVKETLSPAMDILVSSNFERLLWFLAYEVYGGAASSSSSVADKRAIAGEKVKTWLAELKSNDGFGVESAVLAAAAKDFESERVSDAQTLETIKHVYTTTASQQGPKASARNGTAGTLSAAGNYILDPHSAVGFAAALRSAERAPAPAHHIALATAHPAKFSAAVEKALEGQEGFRFEDVLPEQFVGLEQKEKRVTTVQKSEGLAGIRELVIRRVREEKNAA
ncbi:uncharacterized protein K452DRAFT_235719 [Aplosporella prunicola CBS 121167]|uniref:threonine synthase n=1 Tax=Aplosporella prunicola CBS 121167 TaxID=1176127 RepID=A0A6A6B0Y8_9PEZI|nr:uncharacterized protein K452DRAFT_235719 [Aplosporella prunicola CBS 121167]KAF2137516.1 hypothetical protein K452DRAFT_235719 [Aplosporella prunicola CBS 121167]